MGLRGENVLCFGLIDDLNFPLLPQDIGRQDADGQHHDDKDADQTAQNCSVTRQTRGQREDRHNDQHRQNALQAAFDDLIAAGRTCEQAQRHRAEQRGQQVAGSRFDGGQFEHRADEGSADRRLNIIREQQDGDIHREHHQHKYAGEDIFPSAAALFGSAAVHALAELFAKGQQDEEAAQHADAHQDHHDAELTACCRLEHLCRGCIAQDLRDGAGDHRLIGQRTDNREPPPCPHAAQHCDQDEQAHHDGQAGHDGKDETRLDDVRKLFFRDAQFQTVIVCLFQVDQRESRNVDQSSDDQRQQKRT